MVFMTAIPTSKQRTSFARAFYLEMRLRFILFISKAALWNSPQCNDQITRIPPTFGIWLIILPTTVMRILLKVHSLLTNVNRQGLTIAFQLTA